MGSQIARITTTQAKSGDVTAELDREEEKFGATHLFGEAAAMCLF